MSEWNIRAYRTGDAPAIAAIFTYYVDNTAISFETQAPSAALTAERAELIRLKSPYLVAERGGRIVGYAYAKPWSALPAYSRSYESTIYLAHDRDTAGTKGLGTALYKRLIEELPNAAPDIRSLYGVITQDNTASEKMHENLGFTKISVLPAIGYKFGKWLDVSQWLYEFYPAERGA